MNKFRQAISYLESFIPKEQDLGKTMNLTRIRALCGFLGNPQASYPVIHVGGTSGKGSTATFTAEILKFCGLKIGLHLSPHLENITERFQINSHQISPTAFVRLVNQVKPEIVKLARQNQALTPTYFEILVATAFTYFKNQRVGAAVVEVGLGGKLDATNIIPSSGVVLTNISLDHTHILGGHVSKIFKDKSAIIKPNAPFAVSGITQPTLRNKLIKICLNKNVPLYLIQRDFKIIDEPLALPGQFQKTNFIQAKTAAEKFLQYYYPEKLKYFKEAVNRARRTAFIPGRMEIVSKKPLIILDGAHNKAKMTAIVTSVKKLYPNQKFVTVFAVKKDKSFKSMLNLLNPLTQYYILTQFSGVIDVGKFQALNPHTIAKGLTKPYSINKNPHLAVTEALLVSKKYNLSILITGSLYLIGELRSHFVHTQMDDVRTYYLQIVNN